MEEKGDGDVDGEGESSSIGEGDVEGMRTREGGLALPGGSF